ncbi:hypothetical protein L1887_56480 [Cichorium endivia]|nr:hypothetical protein L1887_56480 [Cichorium endivia]
MMDEMQPESAVGWFVGRRRECENATEEVKRRERWLRRGEERHTGPCGNWRAGRRFRDCEVQVEQRTLSHPLPQPSLWRASLFGEGARLNPGCSQQGCDRDPDARLAAASQLLKIRPALAVRECVTVWSKPGPTPLLQVTSHTSALLSADQPRRQPNRMRICRLMAVAAAIPPSSV